jgi:GNAT superfamily N-acetyltransferase
VSLVRAQVREPYFKTPALVAGFLFEHALIQLAFISNNSDPHMSNISVRSATLNDLPALAVLFDGYRQFYGRSSDLSAATQFLHTRLHAQDSVILIAEQHHLAVGFTQLYPSFSSVSMARTFILNDLYIQPSARQQGAARQLIHAAQTWARTQQAIRLTLSTASDNHPAQALYTALGWQKDDQFWVYHVVL